MIPRRPLNHSRGELALCMIKALKVSGPISPSMVEKEAGHTMANDQVLKPPGKSTNMEGPGSFEHMCVL